MPPEPPYAGPPAPIVVLVALIILLLLLTAGCMMGPEIEYVNRTEMDPPPESYREWYEDTAECLNMPSRWEGLRWFAADSLILDHGGLAYGVTNFETNEITIWRVALLYRQTVRHESAHQISGEGNSIHYDGGRRALCDAPEPTD